MADNVQLDEGSSGKYAHTKERTSNIHNSVVEVNIGGASEVLVGGDGTYGMDVDVTRLSVEKAEDAAHSTGDKGIMLLAVRKDTAAALADTDGDYAPLEIDANGKLHVQVGNTSIAVSDGAAAGSASGLIVAGKDGSSNAQFLTTDTDGHLQVDTIKSVANSIQWSHYANEFTSAQTSQDLVAASGSTKIYIGSIRISAGYVASATRTSVRLYFGTSTYAAGTDQLVWGGEFVTIPASGVEAYPGVVIGSGVAPFIISAASDALKLTTAGSTHCRVYVAIDYIQV